MDRLGNTGVFGAIANSLSAAKRGLSIGALCAESIPIHARNGGESRRSLPVRVVEQFVLQLTNGVTAADYYELGLADRRISWFEKRQYIGHYDPSRLFRFLNSTAHEALARDKILFHLYSQSIGLPVVPVVAIYNPGRRALPWPCLRASNELEDYLLKEGAENLFFKTSAGSRGRGALSIGPMVGVGKWVEIPSGLEKTATDIVSQLDAVEPGGAWIIQRRLVPHSDLGDVVKGVMPTVRVMTLLDGEQVHVTGALVRFGDGDGPADNGGTGGIVFLIDLISGRLLQGMHVVDGRSIFRTSHHVTGVEVAGRCVPFWNEVLDLVRSAAHSFPEFRYLGWDVAVTHDGPKILETNSQSGLLSLQKLNGEGVLNTALRRLVAPVQGLNKSGVTLLNGKNAKRREGEHEQAA